MTAISPEDALSLRKGHYGVLGVHDLPAACPLYPRIGPDELTALSAFLRPGLTALSHSSVAKEADMNVIGFVAEELAGAGRSPFDSGLFVEDLSIQHPDEIIRKDALHD